MAGKDEGRWREWMQQFAGQQRRIREAVGLSQERLASLAGVSQGAISRLESGKALATPMVVVLRINLALAAEIRKLDPAVLNPAVRRVLDLLEAVSPPIDGSGRSVEPLFRDSYLQALLNIVRDVPDRHRKRAVSVMRATAQAFADEAED